jgi:molecular chaperone DnaK (HSP70)
MEDSGLKKNQIDEIVLVGGSTRIPKVQQLIKDFFNGKEPNRGINPDEAVAYGAAVQGAILNGNRNAKTADLLLMDVTPLSLGVETTGRVMSVIIPRNTPIPCSKTQTYTTEQNYQTRIDVSVYEGERLKTDDNNLLGEFTIGGLESGKRGEPQVDVTFSIDSNGILAVKAEDKKTGSEAHIDIANRSRANDEDIERMVKEAEKFRKQDLQRVQRIEAKNELETCIYQVLDVVSQIEDSEKKLAGILRQAAEKEQMWLDDGNAEIARVSEIRMRIRNLNKRVQNR